MMLAQLMRDMQVRFCGAGNDDWSPNCKSDDPTPTQRLLRRRTDGRFDLLVLGVQEKRMSWPCIEEERR